MAELTIVATEKVVRARLDAAEQKRLIDEALADVDFAALVPEGEQEGLVAERIEPAARVYADALYAAAERCGADAEVDADLQALLGTLAGNRPLLLALANPAIPREAKKRDDAEAARATPRRSSETPRSCSPTTAGCRCAPTPPFALRRAGRRRGSHPDVEVTTAVALDDARSRPASSASRPRSATTPTSSPPSIPQSSGASS